jgi:hypothetical protein
MRNLNRGAKGIAIDLTIASSCFARPDKGRLGSKNKSILSGTFHGWSDLARVGILDDDNWKTHQVSLAKGIVKSVKSTEV